MWNIKGSIRYFISILAVTFVQMGVFIYAQKILSTSFNSAPNGQNWQSFMLQVFFVAPFLLMVWPAGFFANRFSKSRILAWSSFAMSVFTIAMAILVTCDCPKVAFWLAIGLSCGFAVHSCAKYAIIKEMFGVKNLSFANAFVQIFSLAGLLLASLFAVVSVNLIHLENEVSYQAVHIILSKSIVIPWIIAAVSIFAAIFSFFVPQVKYEDKNLNYSTAKRRFSLGWREPTLRASIIAISMFWAIAQLFVMFFQDVSGKEIVDLLKNSIPFAMAGLVLGSIIAAHKSKDFVETGFIPLGMFGVSIVLFFIPLTTSALTLDLIGFLAGLFGGMVAIPINALIQYNTRPNNSGWVMAFSNAIQSIILIVFLFIFSATVNYTSIPSQYYFWGLSAISFAVFCWSLHNLPQTVARTLLRFVFSRYKLHVLNISCIPSNGSVLLVGNHHSVVDWAMLQMASPRPLSFAFCKDHYEKWYLRILLKKLGIIRIDLKNPQPSIDSINKDLLDGKAVVVFPTGEVSKSPHLESFIFDYTKALYGTKATLVPFYIQGLWGTNYSYSGSDMYGASAERAVTVAFGRSIPCDTPLNEVKLEIQKISIDAWNYAISFVKPIADSWIHTCKKFVKNGPAIYSPDGAHLSGYKLMGAVIAFRNFLKKSNQFKDQDIGVMLPPSSAGIIVNLAIWMLGKVPVNLNYTSSIENVRCCCVRADIKVVITSRTFVRKLRNRGNDYEQLNSEKLLLVYAEDIMEKISKASLMFLVLFSVIAPEFFIKWMFRKHVKMDDVATIIYSSGSEGTPKGVMLSHRNLMGNIQQLACIYNITKEDVMLSELPLFHSFGLTVTTLLNLTEGSPLVAVADPTDVKTMARVCAEFRVTAFVATPTFLRALTNSRYVHPLALEHVRIIIAGAESLRPELLSSFKVKFGKDIFEGYGCTETAPVASTNSKNTLRNDYVSLQQNNKPGTVGMPLPGTQYLIVDPDTNIPLPIGEAGMILVSGCQVMIGYLKDEERTKQAIVYINGKRYYRTGDKGYLDTDGFLTIVDRYSRFAKLGGEMISLGAVERRIQDTKILEGSDYVVTSIPDSVKGEKIVLLFQGEKTSDMVTSELRSSGMPPLMIPSIAYKMDKVPKLGTGKTDFQAAKRIAKELFLK